MTAQVSSASKFMTLERHIIEGERMHPDATGQFSGLLHGLSLAAKLVWREVTKAGLVNILGKTDRMNISGDVVKKLDEFADQTIYQDDGPRRPSLRHGLRGERGPAAHSRRLSAGQVRAALRSAGRVREHRREHHHRDDLFHLPARDRRRAWGRWRTCCSRASGRWRPGTSSSGRA